MEKLLQKIASQINAFDEASLMALWDKYAEQVSRFEPTRRWEEAAIIFGIIQAMRMKNQLFNYSWAQSSKPPEDGADHPDPPPMRRKPDESDEDSGGDNDDESSSKDGKRGKLLQLPKKER
jgi:hypothetical protein